MKILFLILLIQIGVMSYAITRFEEKVDCELGRISENSLEVLCNTTNRVVKKLILKKKI